MSIERIREDRYTFYFEAGERPELDMPNYGKPYRAAVTNLHVRVDEDGNILSIAPRGKKLKKDGSLSLVSAYFSIWDVPQVLQDLAIRLVRQARFNADPLAMQEALNA